MMLGREEAIVEGKEENAGSSGTPSLSREAGDKKAADLA